MDKYIVDERTIDECTIDKYILDECTINYMIVVPLHVFPQVIVISNASVAPWNPRLTDKHSAMYGSGLPRRRLVN